MLLAAEMITASFAARSATSLISPRSRFSATMSLVRLCAVLAARASLDDVEFRLRRLVDCFIDVPRLPGLPELLAEIGDLGRQISRWLGLWPEPHATEDLPRLNCDPCVPAGDVGVRAAHFHAPVDLPRPARPGTLRAEGKLLGQGDGKRGGIRHGPLLPAGSVGRDLAPVGPVADATDDDHRQRVVQMARLRPSPAASISMASASL